MNKKIKIGLVVVLLIIFAGFAYWSQQPSFVIAKVTTSLFFKNRAVFDRSVELNQVAEALADDTISDTLKAMGVDPLAKQNILQSTLALKMVESLKPQLVGYVHKSVDAYFVGEPVVNSSGESLNSVLLMLLAARSTLKFDWKFYSETNPDFSIVSIGFINGKNQKPFMLRVKLEQKDGSWKIVRLYNLVESLSEHI